ncbi:MAG TPA: class II aldolase/adducin family protein [Chloroflexota bacterium]|nr:class II aldolase/adducin family protein [Chloroflexota bacterium]
MNQTIDQGLSDLRRKVALSCRILAMQGLVKETTGHVSARVDERHIVIRGRGAEETALLFTTEDDVLHTDLDGNILSEGANVGLPAEFSLHAEVYKARPEAGCVVHAHPPGILLCGMNDLQLKPIFGAYDPSCLKLAVEGVPVYPRAVTLTTPALGREMVEVMAGKNVCLLYGHGITSVAATVEEATVQAIKLESLARINWHATRNGPVRNIAPEDVRHFTSREGSRRGGDAVWRYYVQLLDHQGILPQELVPSA